MPEPKRTHRVLADVLPRAANNFDLVRLLAALTVIAGHSFYVMPNAGYPEPVTMLVEHNFSGTLAVGVFFFVSGMLITHSFRRSNSPLQFVLLRSARIFPAAIACLLVTALVIGPLVTTMPVRDYLRSAETWCYLRDASQFAGFLPDWPGCSLLPGVFRANHFGPSPNGSMWTLYPELACYAYVLVLGCMGCLRSNLRILVALATLLLLHAVRPNLMPVFGMGVYPDVLKVGLTFMAGAATYALRDRLVLRVRYFVLLALLAIPLQQTFVQQYALYAALLYGTLLFAGSAIARRLRLPGDYSFGVYLYGWPIQQTLQYAWPELTSYPSNLVALPLALLAGWLSWTRIEQPILAWAHQRRFRPLTSGLSNPAPPPA